ASFAGFTPAVNPSISMIVMIDEPVGAHHGGDVAAPVFKRIAEQVLRYMSLPPDVPSYAPQYVVKESKRPPESAAKKGTTGSTQLVGLHVVDGFSPRSDTIDLGDFILPDFHRKSLRQVTEECLKAGLRLQSIGSGAAIEQLPLPGTSVRPGTRVQVRFSS